MRRGRGGKLASALLVLCLVGTACYSYGRAEPPRAGIGAKGLGTTLRVTTRDGRVITMVHARISADSVIGSMESSNARISIPTRDVAAVAESTVNSSKTIGLVVVLALLTAVTYVAISLATLGPNY